MLKKLTYLFVLGVPAFCLTAYAGGLGPIEDDSFKLAIPELKPGLSINAGAVWLKPGASNLNYVINNKGLPIQSPTWNEQEILTGFAPGFEVGFNYAFPTARGQDVSVNWTHVNTNDNASISADNVNYFLGPDYEIDPLGIPIRNASGNVQFKYNVVNVDARQSLAFGQHLELRFFGGLSAGFLQETMTATYTGNTVGIYAGPFSMSQTTKSNFSGVGPHIGLHADYNTRFHGFGILGEASASALMGSMRSNTSYVGSAQQLLVTYNQSINYQSITDQHVYQVIPGFNGKLGLDYSHTFNHGVDLLIEAGYRADVYVNAISRYIPDSLVQNQGMETGSIFVATVSHTLSNYSMQGPFLSVSLHY